MLKPKLTELMSRIDTEEQALFANLSEAERSVQGKADRWSPKDVLAHVAAWKEREAGNLAAIARGESPVKYADGDGINAKDFEQYRTKSWTEILEKAAEANRQLVEQITARSKAELETVGRGKLMFWQLIMLTGCVHPVVHLGQIYMERGEQDYATKLQEEAATALLELGGGQNWAGMMHYNMACHYAQIGKTAEAINRLKKALELNPGLKDWSKEDPDLASIRQEPGYVALVEE